MSKSRFDKFFESVRKVFGKNFLSEITDTYREEPRGLFENKSRYVVKPTSTKQVSDFMGLATKYSIPVVPRGGGTGLVGGQMSSNEDWIIMSLEKMDKIKSFSSLNQSIEVEAGVNLETLQEFVKQKNFFLPLSMASQGSCFIGGNLATNAGGVNVLKYGNARDLCLGLEVVLADGTIFNDLKVLKKDNAGYDIKNLFIGSEGTLGIITSAIIRIYPLPERKVVSLMAISDPKKAVSCYEKISRQLGNFVQAYELISSVGIDFLKEKNLNFFLPFKNRPNWIVLIELAFDNPEVEEEFLVCLENLQKQSLIEDAIVSENSAKAQRMWAIRESIPEANRLVGAISSNDISIPIDKISDFIKFTNKKIKRLNPELRVNCFGHIGDGNLHYNVFPPKGGLNKLFFLERDKLKKIINEGCYNCKGSISAEHGIGRLKVEELKKYGDKGKLLSMAKIKKAFDPAGLLNPGVMFEN